MKHRVSFDIPNNSSSSSRSGSSPGSPYLKSRRASADDPKSKQLRSHSANISSEDVAPVEDQLQPSKTMFEQVHPLRHNEIVGMIHSRNQFKDIVCHDTTMSIETLNSKTVPKSPWEKTNCLVQKLSLPPDASTQKWIPNYPTTKGLHLPVARTFSDSMGYQDQQQKKRNAKPCLTTVRKTLESEDSSYDSDQDNADFLKIKPNRTLSKSHDDVSRTSSETLRAEYEEYITQGILQRSRESSPALLNDANDSNSSFESIIRDPGYTAKLEFALRLGYTEQLLQKALMKLGQGAAENQILEELIRLQKTKPGKDMICSESVVVLQQPLPPQQVISEDNGQTMSVHSDSSEPELLPIVIDGSNVAMSHGNKEIFSCKGIKICVNWFQSRGHKEITVFVPMWRKESSKPDTPITDQYILSELEKERLLFFTPSRQVRGKRFVCHDDRYILNLAAETGAIVVSNDNYRDLINEKTEFKKVIEEKILMYSFVNDRFMPPDDPLGRNGPTLDQFLRRKPSFSADVQPCPYGRKCTYGNKCKFFHAERGNQPQKSITDKLKEHSSQKINEVRAREQGSRDSSPGDVLTRTKSMQPLQRGSEGNIFTQQDKQSLYRTRSTFPKLTVTQASIDNSSGVGTALGTLWQQQSTGHNLAQHTMSLGPPPARPMMPLAPPMESFKSFSFENMSPPGEGIAMWNKASVIPDTSLPPPPPRSPWGMVVTGNESGGDSSNLHRKLARQLTLNPSFDPRILHQNPQAMPPTFPYPPPGVIPTNVMEGNPHALVTRNASAPDKISSSANQTGPVSNPTLSTLEFECLQACSTTTSESSLDQGLSIATTSPSSSSNAVSPIITSSDGVWQTKTTTQTVSDFSEMRSRLYYHLAAVFPEDQVLMAMRAHPEETEPQVICRYILSLNRMEQKNA